MTFWLRHFPLLEPTRQKQVYPLLEGMNDQWNGPTELTVKERSWDGLASVSFHAGGSGVGFYGASIEALRKGLGEACERVRSRDFLPLDVGKWGHIHAIYNGAHLPASPGVVFESAHPANPKIANALVAMVHQDGAVSAVICCKRPWLAGQMALPPGFFDAMMAYLTGEGKQSAARRRRSRGNISRPPSQCPSINSCSTRPASVSAMARVHPRSGSTATGVPVRPTWTGPGKR